MSAETIENITDPTRPVDYVADLAEPAGSIPVDPPAPAKEGPPRIREVRPILPAWVLDPTTRRQAATWGLRWASHSAAFHSEPST
jgi:hypothetical protein